MKKIKVLENALVIPKVLNDFETFFATYNHKRTSTVIIGDEFPKQVLLKGLININKHPELAATRFILSLSRVDLDLIRKATLMGFRDVIPLDLDDNIWIDRFNFSCSGLPQVVKNPTPQMTMKSISAVQVPARVVWINKSLNLGESKIQLNPGSQLKLNGGLADFLGIKGISLKVIEKRTENSDIASLPVTYVSGRYQRD